MCSAGFGGIKRGRRVIYVHYFKERDAAHDASICASTY